MARLFVGHQQTRSICAELYKKDKFPHVLLLHGMKSIGKFTFAKELASYLLSDETDLTHFPFLEEDHPTRTLISCGNHPDLYILSAEEKSLDVQTVREMIHHISLTPMHSKRVVVIIDHAENINIQGQNAILKSLEEPPAHVYFIMTTTAMHALPVTVLSRSWLLDMHPLEEKEIQALLPADISKEKQTAILDLSLGSPGIALKLAEIELLNEFTSSIHNILEGHLAVELLTFTDIPDEIAHYIVGLLIHRKAKEMFIAEPLSSINTQLQKAQAYLQDALPPLQMPLWHSLRQALSCFVPS